MVFFENKGMRKCMVKKKKQQKWLWGGDEKAPTQRTNEANLSILKR